MENIPPKFVLNQSKTQTETRFLMEPSRHHQPRLSKLKSEKNTQTNDLNEKIKLKIIFLMKKHVLKNYQATIL